MALSRLHPFKGLEYLVDAIPQVIAARHAEGKQPPWFLFCGPSRSTPNFGDYRNFLMQRAADKGVASHIVFTGQVAHDEVRSHLAAAHVLVCPSIFEAQNKVVPEACAVGTPSVVTSTTGITSYLAPLDACIPVPPRDAGAIAKGVLQMLNSPEDYNQLQQRALQAAETLRTEQLAPRLEGLWYRAASQRS
jgi:glycosyltransferase involved in cell wall biosynthesis